MEKKIKPAQAGSRRLWVVKLLVFWAIAIAYLTNMMPTWLEWIAVAAYATWVFMPPVQKWRRERSRKK